MNFDLQHETVGDRDIVSVHNGYVSTSRERTTHISGLSQPTIRYLVEPNSTVLSRTARSNSFRLVRRSEIDDDELEVAEGLPEDAFDRLGEEAIDVAHHHND